MRLPITFRTYALAEYEEAVEYYESRREGLGFEFSASIEETLNEIAMTPERYPVVLADVREAIVGRFPYCVYYRVRAGRIVVISVFHHSRDPKDWQQRVNR